MSSEAAILVDKSIYNLFYSLTLNHDGELLRLHIGSNKKISKHQKRELRNKNKPEFSSFHIELNMEMVLFPFDLILCTLYHPPTHNSLFSFLSFSPKFRLSHSPSPPDNTVTHTCSRSTYKHTSRACE
jgi:hypothetical protein